MSETLQPVVEAFEVDCKELYALEHKVLLGTLSSELSGTPTDYNQAPELDITVSVWVTNQRVTTEKLYRRKFYDTDLPTGF